MADAIDELETKIAAKAVEFADLMHLARLKFLNRERQSDVLAGQIAELERRLAAAGTDQPSGGGAGQPAQ